MKALITGAAGRIGRALLGGCPPEVEAEVLLGPSDAHIPGVAWYRSDITDHDRTIMALTCAAPDVVIHCAAMTDVDVCERDSDAAMKVNEQGTRNVAEACRRAGARMVYLSTDYVFDGASGPYSETDVVNPVNTYGRSKRAGEEAMQDIIPDALIVRLSVPFGNRDEGAVHTFVSWMREEFAAGRTVRAATDQVTTPAFLVELSEVVWKAAMSAVGGIIHYGTQDRLSRHAMAITVARVFGFNEGMVVPVTTDELGFTAPRPLESGFVTERVAGLLDRTPILFESALKRMLVHAEGLL